MLILIVFVNEGPNTSLFDTTNLLPYYCFFTLHIMQQNFSCRLQREMNQVVNWHLQLSLQPMVCIV